VRRQAAQKRLLQLGQRKLTLRICKRGNGNVTTDFQMPFAPVSPQRLLRAAGLYPSQYPGALNDAANPEYLLPHLDDSGTGNADSGGKAHDCPGASNKETDSIPVSREAPAPE